MTTRSISEIKLVRYGFSAGGIVYDCEPSKGEIDQAVAECELEVRGFQTSKDELKSEWTQEARGDVQEFARLQTRYHARRIAYLFLHGWTDPIEVDGTGTIIDGSHRIRAAILKGWQEIQVKESRR